MGGKPTPDSEVDTGAETAGGAAVEDAKFDPDSLRAAAAEGLDGDSVRELLEGAGATAERLADTVDERTVRIDPELDEDAFFTAEDGGTTVVNRYGLERASPRRRRVTSGRSSAIGLSAPYAFVIILHSEKENEKKYYLIEPHLSPIEADLKDFLAKKLKTAIKYSSDQVVVQGSEDARAGVIERETHELLERYGLYDDGARPDDGGVLDGLRASSAPSTRCSSGATTTARPMRTCG